jgi:uncharacterized membrane protein
MKSTAQVAFAFNWRHVILPLSILLLSVVIAAIFYSRLPFSIAYHFGPDGSPDMWAIPALFVFWALLLQLAPTMVAIAFTWIISRVSTRFADPQSAVVNPQTVMLFIGNMLALPQIILFFALLDIFIYNSYQVHLRPPVWVFALIAMVLGVIVFGVFFVRALWRVWLSNKK